MHSVQSPTTPTEDRAPQGVRPPMVASLRSSTSQSGRRRLGRLNIPSTYQTFLIIRVKKPSFFFGLVFVSTFGSEELTTSSLGPEGATG